MRASILGMQVEDFVLYEKYLIGVILAVAVVMVMATMLNGNSAT
jgi:cell division protein FtsL